MVRRYREEGEVGEGMTWSSRTSRQCRRSKEKGKQRVLLSGYPRKVEAGEEGGQRVLLAPRKSKVVVRGQQRVLLFDDPGTIEDEEEEERGCMCV